MYGPRYQDRFEAGRMLAEQLRDEARTGNAIVLALPRGGVPVGFEVARVLGLPLDVFLVRKLGTPGHEELAMGAIASGGVRILNPEVIEELGIPREAIDAATEAQHRELVRREHEFRAGRPPLDVRGRTVLLVDDGLATGSTMRAAVAGLRELSPARIVVAAAVGSGEAVELLSREADAVVCPRTPEPFYAVGLWFEDFEQTTDAEVRELLARASRTSGAEVAPPAS